jgi:cytochrome c553
MRTFCSVVAIAFGCALIMMASVASAAYQHAGDAENDARIFLNVYPDAAGSKLDNCVLCHGGGQYTDPKTQKTTTLGSCQYCHAMTSYGTIDQYEATLNSYGRDYLSLGRSEAALAIIGPFDSDEDGYLNAVEIAAVRYPGDQNDDPTKVTAPFRIFDKAQLEALPQHSQFMLMNTTKSGDYYVEYSGVVLEKLLKAAGIRADATKISVYAPDGYAINHPLVDDPANEGSSYAPYVYGTYPQSIFYYDAAADKAQGGWCDYSSPGTAGRSNGDPIEIANGLRMLLALRAEGVDLVPGRLDSTNKLASGTEGPFRTVTPQKLPGPPDQPSTNSNPSLIWPFSSANDHNAGFSTKSATIIKVEPMPEGTTDVDVLEAGWSYVDSGKIVVYGDIDPRKNILDKLSNMISVVQDANADAFNHRGSRRAVIEEIRAAHHIIAKGYYKAGLRKLEKEILPRIESCNETGRHHGKNWITDCDLQQRLFWSLQEIITLLNIVV